MVLSGSEAFYSNHELFLMVLSCLRSSLGALREIKGSPNGSEVSCGLLKGAEESERS